MKEIYDDLEWDVSEMPIGCSTPDEFSELSYHATAECPHCGNEISGIANYWSRDEISYWLEYVEYQECECEEDEFETYK